MPDGFISPEWEMPISDGLYEVRGMFGKVGVTLYDRARGGFIPIPGIIGLTGWRPYVPDGADIAEFRARIGCCYPREGGTPHPPPAATPSPRGEG